MIDIIIADDHHIVRQGIRTLLDAERDFRVVAEASDGLEVVRLVEELTPNVLVTDLMMPHLNGLGVARQISRRVPQTGVLLLSMHKSESYVTEALRHGAMGYVLKDSTASDLVEAVHAVAAGRRYLSPLLSQRAVDAYAERAREAEGDAYHQLSPREQEIFQMTAEGLSSTQIAERLSISPRTVDTHRANLMRKLDLHGQTDVIRFALQRGIIS